MVEFPINNEFEPLDQPVGVLILPKINGITENMFSFLQVEEFFAL